VNANTGLLRLDGVDVVFGLAALFGDGQEAHGGDGLERIGGRRMPHAKAHGGEVVNVNDRNHCDEGDENPLDDGADWRQRTIPLGQRSADTRK